MNKLLDKLNSRYFKIDLRPDEVILSEFRVNKKIEDQIRDLLEILDKFKKQGDEPNIMLAYKHLATFNDYLVDKLLSAKRKSLHCSTNMKAHWNAIANECEDLLMNPACGLYAGLGIDIKNPKLNTAAIYLYWANIKNHTATTGTTRVGKTYKMLSDIKQITRARENIVVFDPKEGEEEEILKTMWDCALKEHRQRDWKHISPERIDHAFMFYNFIYGLNNQEIASLMSDLVGDKFYKEIAYDITLTVLESYEYIERVTDPSGLKTKELLFNEIKKARMLEKHFTTEYSYDQINNIVTPNIVEQLFKLPYDKVKQEQVYFSRTLITLKDIAYYFNMENLESLRSIVKFVKPNSKTQEYKESALRLINKVLATDSGFMSKVSKSTDVIFTQLTTGPIGKILNTIRCNTLRDDLFNPNKSIMLLVQTSSMKYKAISSYLSKIVLKMFENIIGQVAVLDEKLYRPISVLIDEANAVLYPGIEDLFNKAGGIGLKLFVYTQSFADYILKLTKENASVVLDNINTYFMMRMNEEESIKKAAEKVGKLQRVMTSLQFSDSLMFRSGSQISEVSQIQNSDFTTFEVGHSILVHYGKLYWMQHPQITLPKIKIIMPESNSRKLRAELEKQETVFLMELERVQRELAT